MSAIRRILVSIKDPAAGVTPGVRKALQLARAIGAELELFHALTMPIYLENYLYADTSLPQIKHDLLARQRANLEHMAHALAVGGPKHGERIRVHAAWDFPAHAAVIRRARAIRADLVVADRHAGRHFARRFMRFTDWELLRLCPLPVLLAGPGGVYRRPAVLAALDPAHSADKPLKLDNRILEVAAAFSGALRGQLHTIHAYESVPSGMHPVDALDPATARRLNIRIRAAAVAR